MTFNDILFKLLPFTYIDDKTEKVAFGSWSALSDGDVIITFVELLLFGIFIYALVRLAISWRKDRRQIGLLATILQKYKSRIQEQSADRPLDVSNEYHALMGEINNADPKLRKLWREFDESLIKKGSGDNLVIRNAIDAEYFFNKKTMISHLGSKLFAAIPGMLLGIGLLGTFFGLYFALVQLNVGEVEALQNSIKILINMAGVKFAASIWGLLLSIIFTFIDKYLEFGLDHKLDNIQTLINQIFVRQSAEQNLDGLLDESTRQTKTLDGLAGALTEKIASEFKQSLMPKLDAMNQHFVDMPQQLSASMGKTFREPLNALSDITASQAQQSQKAIETIIKEFMGELKNTAGDERNKLQAATEHSHQMFASTSEQLHQTFQNVLERQTALATARDEKIMADLREIKSAQYEMIGNMSDHVSRNVRDMNEKISANIARLVETLQQTSATQINDTREREAHMNATHETLVSSLAESIQKDMRAINTEVRNSINTMVKTMDGIATAQNESSAKREAAQIAALEQVNSGVSSNMTAMNEQVSGSLERLVATIESSLSQQQSSAQNRENQITASVQMLLQNIESTVARQLADDQERSAVISNMMQELSLQNRRLINEISTVVASQMSSLNSNSEQLFRQLINQFESHIHQVKSHLEAILGNLKTEVGNIDAIMSSASQRLVGLPAHLDKVMYISDKLLKFSDELTASTTNMLQFNSDFLKTREGLDGYIAKITDSSEALRVADGNLKETLGISKDVMTQMRGEYQELADTNSDTIDVFAHKVDTFMNDYHRNVESAIKDKVIHQLDNALSSYAQTMAEAITNLSDAIDELREKRETVTVYETL